ncbi:uncharacterized protein N7479_007626 [Penicillium vulpinum]|uniref:Uncharacterized protein n=1 Tax=Penicillium vulpinum TaxID=29845 RepID=A0A1V6S9Z9_9EURO|nr:uncharacterized protein N7479_007626 [Penicillium vulpinum]KAJ5960476.1 hypothetical protein N7479_007626 [Penicillium vulpinum]OQE10847.1 hypothetical protein PENVUL_c003G08591 [Penicillium vulpinum]
MRFFTKRKSTKWKFTKNPGRDNGDGALHSPTTELQASSPVEPSSNMTPSEQPSKQVQPASVTSNAGPVLSLAESSSLAVITTQATKQSRQVMSAPAVIPNLTPLSDPTEESPKQAIPISSSDDGDCWASAYNLLQCREPKLIEDYMKHLSSLQHDKSANPIFLSPESIRLIVELLLEDREKKQWRFSLLGKDVKIREQTEKLAKFFLWADPVIKNAVSTQPYAALAWAGVSLLLPLLSSGTTGNMEMLKGFNKIDDTLMYWHICEKKYLRSEYREEYQDLMEPLAKLCSHVIEYQARSVCHLSKAQLSRAWENMTGGVDWESMMTEIERLSEACSSYIPPLAAEEIRKTRDDQLQTMRESRDILDEIRKTLEADRIQTQRNYEDQKERDLLHTLASGYEDDKNFNPNRVPGTCEWFFDDHRLRNWRDSERSSLLWISADPGCGKSVLSRALIDEDRLSTNVTTSMVCYFFFKDGDERRMSATNALCAILHQLFTHDSAGVLIQHAILSHRETGKDLSTNFSELWRILIQCATSPETGEIVCLLDALDECKEYWEPLIDNLREFYSQSRDSSSPSKLKFLITSRPYDDLTASFGRFSDASTYLHFDGADNSVDISNDINLVIDAKVAEIGRGFQESDRQTISKKLKSMENRTYLWLHLTFDIIKQRRSKYSRRSDVEALLSSLPSEIEDAYEKILDRSQDDFQAATLLQLVLSAVRPLTLDEANIALTIALEKQGFSSYDDLRDNLWPAIEFENTVKNLCGLFITVHNRKLFFIHLTARKFLVEPPQGKWKGRLNMTRSHTKMALLCLSTLSYIDEQRPIREIRANFPLAQYSASYLLVHTQSAEAEKDVLDAVSEFFLKQGQAYTAWGKLFDPDQPTEEEPFQDKNMATPLYYASLAGLQRIVRCLVNHAVEVNAQSGFYGNALQAASSEGYKEIVQLLLENGAEVNAQGGFCRNALYAASSEGYKEIVQLLLENGAEVNAQGGIYGNALQAASSEGHKEIVLLLLENGAEINAQVGYLGGALKAAVSQGRKEIAQLLLEKGAEVNAQGGVYGSALQVAVSQPDSQGRKEIVQLLLENGAEVNAQGGYHGNALQAAVSESDSQGRKEIAQLLLEKGAEVNAQGGYYGNTLQAAISQGHKEIVQLLLENGAEVNAQGGYYGSALQAAVSQSDSQGYKEIVQLLLENSADVNAQGGYYGNALQAAVSQGHKEIVQLLLENGAEVNAQGGYYGSALQAAVSQSDSQGHKEIVLLLLEKGAEIKR